MPRHGYQFVAPVTPVQNPEGEQDLELLLAPHRAWTEGRAALESLQCDRIGRARATFQRLLEQHPGEATYHIGMANACVMQFEAGEGLITDVPLTIDPFIPTIVQTQSTGGRRKPRTPVLR